MLNKPIGWSTWALLILLISMTRLQAQRPFDGVIYYSIDKDHLRSGPGQPDAVIFFLSGMRIKRTTVMHGSQFLPLEEEIFDLDRKVRIVIDHEQRTWAEIFLDSLPGMGMGDSVLKIVSPDPFSPVGWKRTEPEPDTLRGMPCMRQRREFEALGTQVDHIGNVGERSVTIWTSDQTPDISRFKDQPELSDWILFWAEGKIPLKLVFFDHPAMGTYDKTTYMLEDIDPLDDPEKHFAIPEGYTKLEGLR